MPTRVIASWACALQKAGRRRGLQPGTQPSPGLLPLPDPSAGPYVSGHRTRNRKRHEQYEN